MIWFSRNQGPWFSCFHTRVVGCENIIAEEILLWAMRHYVSQNLDAITGTLRLNRFDITDSLCCMDLTPASQVEVGCPWARGLQPQYTPRRKNTHRPTNPQPSHEPPRAKPKGPPGRKPGARGLGAAEPQAPRAQTWGTHPHSLRSKRFLMRFV